MVGRAGGEDRVCQHDRVRFEVSVEVMLRQGVADPHGQTIERSLPTLGFEGVHGVRIGKLIRFELDAADQVTAETEVADMAARFLSNPVIEDSTVAVRLLAAEGSPA